jgi:hypothetical protein
MFGEFIASLSWMLQASGLSETLVTLGTASLKSYLFVSGIYRMQELLLLACLIGTQTDQDTWCAVKLLEKFALRNIRGLA